MSSTKGSLEDATNARPIDQQSSSADKPGQLAVVAIGTSAGGLAACTTFLQHVPADTGLAFVIVQHLDPNHESHLVELLSKVTKMPVVQIEDGMQLAPDRVHVIPPGAALTIAGAVLRLLPRESSRPPMPIDSFLRALAEDRGGGAIAVILSGAGSDGSLGVQTIREHGGFTLAQAPADAGFESMPSSAIATGCVDVVLPAADLGKRIASIARDPLLTRAGPAATTDNRPEDQSKQRDLLALLRSAAGVDFAQYRNTTVHRRLRRRIALRGLQGLDQYVDYVHANPGELQELARDILISVTRFFRDPEVFALLSQTAFPDLIRRASSDKVVRMWAPGCSTGEEAYSLVITFMETAQRMHSPVTCQVFATDANETVLEKARRANYIENIAADVSPERLERFFTRSNGHYHINRGIRDLCVFSRHDLLRDPPMSRMDMVSCRNLLIYLDAGQSHAFHALHYAIEPRGYLLLGRSESATSCPELFEAVDKEARLFRARELVGGRSFPRSAGARDARRRTPAPLMPEAPDDASAYEELIAANEELQSLNEELESSKEEIESVNEELTTLNHELRSRNTALHVAHQFAEATIDTVRSGLIVLDRDHLVVNANPSFYKAFQLAPADVERRRIAEVAPEYFGSPAIQELLEQVRATSAVLEDVEVEFNVPGRGRRVLVMNARRFSPGDLYLLSVDDVTLSRQLEQDRRQSQKMEAIGHLAAGVAHDFNNLLTVVLGGSQLAMADLPPESRTRSILESVGAAAGRAAELTHQLLAYAGKSRVYVELVALSDIVTQTANLRHASIPSHVHLRLDLERDLPRLLADPSQMHQVVDNLVKNAIEAIGDKPGTVLVRTGRQMVAQGEIEGPGLGDKLPPGEYVFLEVQDTGVGMTPENQRQMFDPFFTTKFTGRGLGLAAVQGIVRQHHGSIAVTSVMGRGTSIRVLLATTPSTPSQTARPAAKAPQHGTGTVLVVDDEQLVLDTTRAALVSFGYRVITATGGVQALELLRSTPAIAFVVLDATMPGMNGIETLKGIRGIRADVPVLVCSGLGNVAAEQAFANHGIAGFLHKPFSIQQLAEMVAACLLPHAAAAPPPDANAAGGS